VCIDVSQSVRPRIVNAPAIEAREIAERMMMHEDPAQRLALHYLRAYIKEPAFATEFLRLGGLLRLADVIHAAHGNALAYALTAMQNLMARDDGWAALDTAFIARVVRILSSPTSLVNVCRPATAILKRFVEADPASAPGPLVAGSSRGPPPAAPGSVYRYGFDVVFEQMGHEAGVLETVVSRIGVSDTALALHRSVLPRPPPFTARAPLS
jgi:engulfment/cell motility protein 1